MVEALLFMVGFAAFWLIPYLRNKRQRRQMDKTLRERLRGL